MSVLERIIDGAIADTDVLRALDQNGDRFDVPREVDFSIVTDTQETAETIESFINEHHFGTAQAISMKGRIVVQVKITMPVTQSVVLSVSGFMACIAHLFRARYDGWGCAAQRDTHVPAESELR